MTTEGTGPKRHEHPHGARSTNTFMTTAQTKVCHITVTHYTFLTVRSFMIWGGKEKRLDAETTCTRPYNDCHALMRFLPVLTRLGFLRFLCSSVLIFSFFICSISLSSVCLMCVRAGQDLLVKMQRLFLEPITRIHRSHTLLDRVKKN